MLVWSQDEFRRGENLRRILAGDVRIFGVGTSQDLYVRILLEHLRNTS